MVRSSVRLVVKAQASESDSQGTNLSASTYLLQDWKPMICLFEPPFSHLYNVNNIIYLLVLVHRLNMRMQVKHLAQYLDTVNAEEMITAFHDLHADTSTWAQ